MASMTWNALAWLSLLGSQCLCLLPTTTSYNFYTSRHIPYRRRVAAVPTANKVAGRLFQQSRPTEADMPAIRRLSIAGVSVSPQGFWVMLQVPGGGSSYNTTSYFWPLQVTSCMDDTVAATSAESLTLIQLISGVDMAGPILPPEVLGQMAVLQWEHQDDPLEAAIHITLQQVRESLPDEISLFSETNTWQRLRVKLPKVTLDTVQMIPLSFQCTGPQTGPFTIHTTDAMLKEVSYRYDPATSEAFTCLALALRYKAPLILSSESSSRLQCDLLNESELMERFPLFSTVESLRKSSQRVHQNIERGFEIHKLTGALRIAMERGDERAARAIREKLDEYDSMDDLPTLDDSIDADQMQ